MARKKRRYLKRKILGIAVLTYLVFANSCMTMRSSAKETQQFFNEKGVTYIEKTAQIEDKKLHYIQTGNPDGPTLVFVHGSPGSWNAYESYLVDATLIKHFRLIAPDRPGFGKSEFRKSLGLKPQADLLNQLLKKLDNGKPYTLIGHSYGGPLIVKMALEKSNYYENLVVLAGALDPEAEKPEKWRKPLTWIPLKYLVPGALKPSNDELWFLKKDLVEMKPELHRLKTRTLIIHGTADKLVPYSNVPFMKEHFTKVDSLKVMALDSVNHFIVWNQERLIKDAILDWTNPK
ncbi:alpha/beta hydrolase [Muricauda sp. 2012CJ35-5]|uniref:Alpha/beta hydrolase n=1 Tax=Flagellimonas spongiicola TaxID=2942208 RepID=A0ABT0PPD7_9FLAO|nr:alpha/beta hydrolase [Allomuricauda spongiicola]MCL6273263.1 alpha/beta hydrolase [Allomuricauda spongiicola]